VTSTSIPVCGPSAGSGPPPISSRASRRTYRKLLDNQILPTFERATLGAIDTLVVREWIAGLVEQGLSPSRVRNAHQVLSQVLAAGVEGGRIAATLRPGCGYRASSAGTCTS
jgi:hypothetical protein